MPLSDQKNHSSQQLDHHSREQVIRNWISRRESIYPYAPSLARFFQLPDINSIQMQHIYYLAKELKSFYSAKENGKRIGRWILMPEKKWKTHEEEHTEAEKIFWFLNASYYYLNQIKVRPRLI